MIFKRAHFYKDLKKFMDKNLLKLLRKFTIVVKLPPTFSTVKLKLNHPSKNRIQPSSNTEQQVAQICTRLAMNENESSAISLDPRPPAQWQHSITIEMWLSYRVETRTSIEHVGAHELLCATVLCNADISRSFIVSARDSAPRLTRLPPLYVSPPPSPRHLNRFSDRLTRKDIPFHCQCDLTVNCSHRIRIRGAAPVAFQGASDCSRFLNKIWGPITAVGTRFLRCEGGGLEDIGWNSIGRTIDSVFLRRGKFKYVYMYEIGADSSNFSI